MTDIYLNIGTPTIASRGFVPLAVEAGVCATIKSLLSGLAMDKRTLLLALKKALGEGNPPPNIELAAALNYDNLDAVVAYMQRAGMGVAFAGSLPALLDEDGPAAVSAGRDGTDSTQINIGYGEPPEHYTAEIYLDGVFAKNSDLAATEGTVWDILAGVADDGAEHTVRVLFVDAEGSQTRFGPPAAFA